MSTVKQHLRFQGQYFDSETELNYNYFRDYNPAIGRYIESDPIGLNGGMGTFNYALNNPVTYVDPYGLTVYRCSQPAFGWMPINHEWIKTDTVEAGMGPVGGNGNAGNQKVDMPGDPVEITDHSGRSSQESVSCEVVDNVDENVVNTNLIVGTSLGRWGPANQCQSFVNQVLRIARLPMTPRLPTSTPMRFTPYR